MSEIYQTVISLEYIPGKMRDVEELINQTEGISLKQLKVDHQLALVDFVCITSRELFDREEFERILNNLLQ